MPRKTKMNDLTNPTLISEVNVNNKRLKEDFLLYLKSIQRSPGTIRGYSNDLDIFFVYVLEHLGNKDFKDVSKRDLITFQNWLIAENENSPARIRRIKAVISSLSNYIENILDEEEEFKNFKPIVRKIENPVNEPVREKTILTDTQLQLILDTLVNDGKYEKACLLALAMYSGRRKSELVRFKVSYFDDENVIYGSLYKTPERIKTKGRGNGKYLICYTLYKPFKPYFDLWMKQRAEEGITSEWLFPSNTNQDEQLSPGTVTGWMNSFGRIIGVDLYAHALRHYFTTHLAESGIPSGVIQTILGWSSADMVNIYTDTDQDEKIGAYFKDGEIISNQKGLEDL